MAGKRPASGARAAAPLLAAFVAAVLLHAAALPAGVRVLAGASRGGGEPVELSLCITEDTSDAVDEAGPLAAVIEVMSVGGPVGAWVVDLRWSADRRFDDDDLPLVWKAFTADAEAAWSERMSLRADAPAGVSGPGFLVARVAGPGGIAAYDSRGLWIEPAAAARLRVEAIDAPQDVAAGGMLAVGLRLGNAADAGWRRGGWRDELWLSTTPTLDGEAVRLASWTQARPLAPGQSRSASPREASLPLDVPPGEYFVVYRGPAEALPTPARLTVRRATHPDLAVRNVRGPEEVVLGRPASLRFDVVNRSPVATPDDLWADRVYLSVDDELSADDVPLVSQPRLAALPGRGAYRAGPHPFVIAPEMLASDAAYLIVSTDDEGDIDEGLFEANNTAAWFVRVVAADEAEPPEPLALGREDEPERLTVAWIAYDDFQEVLARAWPTLQPEVQAEAEPTPEAPLARDPGAAASAPAAAASPPTPPEAEQGIDLPDSSEDGALAAGPPEAEAEAEPLRMPRPVPPTPPAVASAEAEPEDRPTSAPRADREADATTLENNLAVRPGGVLVGPGLEVQTFRPRFSAAARVSSTPTNPVARITFDLDGTVLHAELSASTGFANVDGPLLSALYRWKATGPRVERWTTPQTIEITILLGPGG
ncbi:MAG: hypothetical protein AAF710_03905 [Planctomycetota bacterium]